MVTTMVTREGTQIKQHTNLEYEGSRYVRHGFQGLRGERPLAISGIVWNEISQKLTESPNCRTAEISRSEIFCGMELPGPGPIKSNNIVQVYIFKYIYKPSP